jgi:hypothetical protein
MWCQHCQQEVPAASGIAGGTWRCSRCLREALPAVDAATDSKPGSDSPVLADLLDDTAGQRLRDVGRRLSSYPKSSASDPLVRFRVDPPHFVEPTAQAVPGEQHRPQPATGRWLQALAWMATTVGCGLLLAGGGIIAQSLLTSHANWWSWGLGCVLVGQSLVVVGLLRVLVSLWTASREAQLKLSDAQQRLAALRRATDALVGERHPTAASFFAHLSREANPHMLLASLRGQLDELVSRMHADV